MADIPFPDIPLDEIGGNRLTGDQLATIVAYIFKHHLTTEVKVAMLYGGRHAFNEKCARAYGHLGLRQKHFRTLWVALNNEIPHVALATQPTHIA